MIDPAIVQLLIETYGPTGGIVALGCYLWYETHRGRFNRALDRLDTIDKRVNVLAAVTQSLAKRDKEIDHERVRHALEKNGIRPEDFLRMEEQNADYENLSSDDDEPPREVL